MDEHAPAHIGPYALVDRIGAGGMGVVYLARREGAAGFSRPVVVKVLHDHLAADPRLVEMFLDEARLAGRLAHAHVIGVEDCGLEGGRPYLTMPYVHGVALQRVLEEATRLRRRIAIELAVSIAIDVADALHAVHELRDDHGALLSVVHRDVSPGNVLVGVNGHVALTDFGVAKSRQRARESTAGALRGKLGYMAPEQVAGGVVDRTSDVYALGVVLWEMLTGQRCFGGSIANVVRRLEHAAIVPPSSLRPEVPEALDAALARALCRDASARPSARSFRRELTQALPGAAMLDDEPLSALVSALFGRELDALRARLPRAFSSALLLAPPIATSDPWLVEATLVD